MERVCRGKTEGRERNAVLLRAFIVLSLHKGVPLHRPMKFQKVIKSSDNKGKRLLTNHTKYSKLYKMEKTILRFCGVKLKGFALFFCIKAAQNLSSFFYCADRRNHLIGTPPAFCYNCCEAATIYAKVDYKRRFTHKQ